MRLNDKNKVLIYARATGAVDNTACRDFSGLDTLTASRVLRRLRDKGLLQKHGGGSRTYYVLHQPAMPVSQSMKGCNPSPAVGRGLPASIGGLLKSPDELATLPPELATLLATLADRTSTEALRSAIVHFCAWRALTVDELATLLGRKRDYLRNKHLIPMVRDGQLRFRYPESAKHPHQAYIAAQAGNEQDE